MENSLIGGRPERFSQEVLEKTAKEFYPTIENSTDWSDLFSDADELYNFLLDREPEEIIDEYRLTRAVEEELLSDADMSLLDLMEGLYPILSRIHKNLEKQWVKESGVSPKLSLGDTVKFYQRRRRQEAYKGQIVHIDHAQGKYHVRSEELGHVPEGEMGVHASIFNFETLEEWQNE